MSPLREMFSGTLWVVAARWGIRGIGLVSTVVLARLLTPHDFGVVALAMLVVGMIEVLSDTGMVVYIIRHPDPQRSHFDTVFTMRLIVGVLLAAVIYLAAPWGAAFFSEPEIETAIRILALRPLLYGLENPGIIWFRKNMRFSKDFEFMVLNKAVTFVVTVTAAVILRNHWALVIGILAGGVIATLQSYPMHPFRPRLSLAEVRHMWGFSAWMLLVNLLEFANNKLDEIIIGRVRSTTEMGYYNVGSDVAATPVQEIVYPMTRVWIPAFAKLAHNPVALAHTYRWVISAVGILALSVSVGLALVARDFAYVVLGPTWMPAVPVIQILAIAAGMAAMTLPLTSVLGATGDPRVVVGLALVRTVLLLATMVPAAIWYGLPEVALGRAVSTAIALVVSLLVFERVVKLAPLTLIRGMVRPLVAALAMSGVVLLVQEVVPAIAFVRLVACAAAGAVTFVAALLGLWVIAGRPPSVEHDAVVLLGGYLRALRSRWVAPDSP